MATYIKTLKEDNGDITYPQTKAGAVLLNNGSDLETELSQYVTAEDIASTSALTPPVQTNMIADGAVTTRKIANKAVTSDKINWTTSIRTVRMPGTASTTPTSAWKEFNLGSSATVTGLIPGKTYLVRTSSDWTEGKGEFRTNIKAGTTSLSMRPYNSNGALTAVSYEDVITIPSGVTAATIQRAYSGEKVGVRIGATRVTFQIID